GYALDITDDGGYVVAGWAENYGPGIRAVYVVKTDSLVVTESLNVIPYLDPVSITTHKRPSFPLHPNPINSGGTIHFSLEDTRAITLTDLSGRIINQQNCNN